MIICLGTTPARQRTMVFSSLRLDSVNRATQVHETASGKPINVARTLRALGHDATVAGFAGGPTGAFLRRDLDAAGVAHQFVEVVPETRTCITAVDLAAGTATELVEESKAVAPEAWIALYDVLDGLLRRPERPAILVLSGSLTPGAPVESYARCVAMADRAGVRTIVDASGESLRKSLAQRPFVVKPNRTELAATLGLSGTDEATMRDAMVQLVREGATWAVVTMGAAGLLATNGNGFWRVTSPRIPAINPIGSGDAMAAGLAAGLTLGQDVPEACQLGAACGAANALQTITGWVNRTDVERLLPAIVAQRD